MNNTEASNLTSRWQPIETAPKDGPNIQGWADDWIPEMAWSANAWCSWDSIEEYWAPLSKQPTHWQPQPQPPAGGVTITLLRSRVDVALKILRGDDRDILESKASLIALLQPKTGGDLCAQDQVTTNQSGASNSPADVPSEGRGELPVVVCLCGSSKYPDEHMRVMMSETLAGRIVIPMGLYGHADFPPGAKAATNDGDEATEVKQMLDTLHHRKIDLADEILVVNVGGYIGSSTKREIAYAESTGKRVRYFMLPTEGSGASPQPPIEIAESPYKTEQEANEARLDRTLP